MVVTDDAWGNSSFLTFYGGLPPVNKPYAMVEHRGMYVSKMNFVDWDSIPKTIRNNMFKDYSEYRGMYSTWKSSGEKNHGPEKIFYMRTGKY